MDILSKRIEPTLNPEPSKDAYLDASLVVPGDRAVAPQPTIVEVRALTDEEVAAFWNGNPLRIYTRLYVAEFCRINGLALVGEGE